MLGISRIIRRKTQFHSKPRPKFWIGLILFGIPPSFWVRAAVVDSHRISLLLGSHIFSSENFADFNQGLFVSWLTPKRYSELALFRSTYGDLSVSVTAGRRLSKSWTIFAVANLSHNASFHFIQRIAPSNHGIKHVGPSICAASPTRITNVSFRQATAGRRSRLITNSCAEDGKKKEEIKKRPSQNAACSTNLLSLSVKQKSNQSFRYETAVCPRTSIDGHGLRHDRRRVTRHGDARASKMNSRRARNEKHDFPLESPPPVQA